MPDLTSDLPHKVEGALHSYISGGGLSGVSYYGKGHIAGDVLIPSVVAICADVGDEVVKDTAVKQCRVVIEIRSSGEDLTAHKTLVGAVNDLIQRDDIATLLTAAGDNFHVYDISFVGTRLSVEEQNFLTQVELDAVCCAATVTT